MSMLFSSLSIDYSDEKRKSVTINDTRQYLLPLIVFSYRTYLIPHSFVGKTACL